MANHQETCDVCDQIALCEQGNHPRAILRTSSGWAVMGPSQYFLGYCLLLVREPVTEIFELTRDARDAMWSDLEALSQAVAEATQCHKINYEALGNQCHHLHWHVFPRQLSELHPGQPIWVCSPEETEAAHHTFRETEHANLLGNIRARLIEHLGR